VARVQESQKGHDIVIEEPTVGAERRVLEEEAQEEQPRLPQEFRLFIPAGGGERRASEVEAQEEPLLSIDGRPVKVIRNSDGTYSSEGVFYTSYPTLLDLARASIDIHLPEG
jgi:hypothetical protein